VESLAVVLSQWIQSLGALALLVGVYAALSAFSSDSDRGRALDRLAKTILFCVAMVYAHWGANTSVTLAPRGALLATSVLVGGRDVALATALTAIAVQALSGGPESAIGICAIVLELALCLAVTQWLQPARGGFVGWRDMASFEAVAGAVEGAPHKAPFNPTPVPYRQPQFADWVAIAYTGALVGGIDGISKLGLLNPTSTWRWQTALSVSCFQIVATLLLAGVLEQKEHRRYLAGQLRGLYRRAQTVVEAVPDLLVLQNRAGNYVKCLNPEGHPFRVFGDYLVGKTSFEVMPMEDALRRLRSIEEVLTKHVTLTDAVSPAGAIPGYSPESLARIEVRLMPYDDDHVLICARDVTELVHLKSELDLRNSKLKLILQSMRDVAGLIDQVGEPPSYVTPSCEAVLGYPAKELMRLSPSQLVVPEDLSHVMDTILDVLTSVDNAERTVVFRARHKTGRIMWLETVFTRVQEHQAAANKVLFRARDISQKYQLLERLQLSDFAINNIQEAVAVCESGTAKVVWVNRPFERITGYAGADLIGHTLDDVLCSRAPTSNTPWTRERDLFDAGRWEGELVSRRKDGTYFPEWRHTARYRNAQDGSVFEVNTLQDLTDQREQEKAVWQLRTRDADTDLPNRDFFLKLTEDALAAARLGATRVAVLGLALRRYEAFAHTFGLSISGTLLKDVVIRLRSALRDIDTLGRSDAGELFVLLGQFSGSALAIDTAKRLIHSFDQGFVTPEGTIYLSVNIGMSMFPEHGDNAVSLLQNTQTALDEANLNGAGHFKVFDESLRSAQRRRLSIEMALRNDLETSTGLGLMYQPKLNLSNGAWEGLEALCRWNNEKLGIVTPAEFIPVAEASGLIVKLGPWTLREACLQQRQWRAEGYRLLPVAVNLAAKELHEPDLLTRVRDVLESFELNPQLLELEVTESDVMRDLKHSGVILRKLRALGLQIALDDFGTGHSSLAYLKTLPLDTLKVDASFILGLAQEPQGAAMCRAVLSLAQALKLKTVAEGVETEEQAKFLRNNGCIAAQGWLYSKALPAGEISPRLIRLEAGAPVIDGHFKELQRSVGAADGAGRPTSSPDAFQ